MKYQIAIIEDNVSSSNELKEMLIRYSKENDISFSTHQYNDGLSFINDFKAQYDVIFLDIEMPYMNGMEAAKKVRQSDEKVLIIFVTNLAQFAVDGYQARAFDFIIKPLNYANFKMKLKRIANQLEHDKSQNFLVLQTRNFTKKVFLSDILYLEVKNHDVLFHLCDSTLEIRSSLTSWEEKLSENHFARCNSYTLVNLAYVDNIQGDELIVHGETLHFSRNKRTIFLNAFGQYVGGTK